MAVRDSQTEWLRVKIYREMTPQQRIWLAAQLYEEGIANVRSAILDRHPHFSEEEIAREIRRRVLPRRLFEQVEAELQRRKQYGAIPHPPQSHWGARSTGNPLDDRWLLCLKLLGETAHDP